MKTIMTMRQQAIAVVTIGAIALLAGWNRSASQTAPPPKASGVRFAMPPSDAKDVALDAAKTFGLRGRKDISPGSLEVAPPLASYTLAANLVAQGATINQAVANNIFYVAVLSKGVPIAGVSVQVNAGRASSFGNINTEGPFLDNIAPAVAKLAGMTELKSGSYEARLLGIGMHVVIWLKSDAPNGDRIFVQTQPFIPKPLKANQLYPANDFLKAIQPAIQRWLRESSGAPGE